ncbi:MAG: tetratricopeptide repeat protein [Anaerolineales bacterium]
MRALLYRALILLTVIGLIIVPPITTGYASLRQAQVAYVARDNLRASKAYERAATLLPWRPDLWDLAGITRFQTKDYEDSIRLLEIARKEDVLSDVGWDVLGISYFHTERVDEATMAWESGLESFPEYSKYYSHLIFIYHERGDTQAEKHALERWVASDGATDAAAHYRLGQLLSISEPERALEEFTLASSLDSEYDSAVETMRTALNLATLETEDSKKLVFIGRGLGLINEWSLAQKAFRQAVEADGENPEAWAWLGEAEQQLGRDGRVELNRALKYGRTDPIVRSLRGLYWMRQGHGKQALAEYLLAAEYDPDNPAWQISIGDAYALSGDLQAALESYFRATEIEPTDSTIWRALAAFSAQYNMQVEEVGLPAAQTAVELGGEDPLALDTLGWTLALLERYDEAQDTLEQALELDPDFAQVHLHLGIVAMQTDNWEVAGDHLRRARELDGDGPVGEQVQVLLNQYFP